MQRGKESDGGAGELRGKLLQNMQQQRQKQTRCAFARSRSAKPLSLSPLARSLWLSHSAGT